MTDQDVRAGVAHTPVLICGGGAAGLTAATTLARYGVRTVLVERRADASPLPRATVASVRTMEILRRLGISEHVRAGADDAEPLVFSCSSLAEVDSGVAVAAGYPTRAQAAAFSPEAALCVAQDHLEAQLRALVDTSPVIDVRAGVELTRVAERPDGVRCELRDTRTGRICTVATAYVVAADGAASTVRCQLGIPMHGEDHVITAVRAQLRAPLWELVGPYRYVLYSITGAGFEGNFLPAGQRDRWLYGVPMHLFGEIPADHVRAELQRRIRAGAGRADLPMTIEKTASFTSAAKLAGCFRSDRTFLIGDAAHVVSPRGGTGMNMAVHDGYNLAWKIAWAVNGWASPSILDSYEQERRPVAEHNVRRSADPNGSVRAATDEIHIDLGGRIQHAWLPGTRQTVSTLDQLGDGWTMFCGPTGDQRRMTRPSAAPVTVHHLDAATARALAIDPAGAALVRPDGVTVRRWPTHAGPAGSLPIITDTISPSNQLADRHLQR